MKNIILTGAPGAGKTVLIRELDRLGHRVIEEAATDIIAREQARGVAAPWEDPSFIENIMELQLLRMKTPGDGRVCFHDRSLVCTAALADFLGFSIPASLTQAIVASRDSFEPRVFFVRLLGFMTPTEARQIGLEESQRFEAVHERHYREYGFDPVFVQPADIQARIRFILGEI